MTWEGGNAASKQTHLDPYVGYGTGFNNPDRFKLEMKERVHLISPSSSPFLSWASAVRKNPTSQVEFSWMEDELFTHRNLKASLKRSVDQGTDEFVFGLQLHSGADWQAFEAAAAADVWTENKPLIYMTIKDANGNKFHATIRKNAVALGPTDRDIKAADGTTTVFAGALNMITIANDSNVIGGASAEVEVIPDAAWGGTDTELDIPSDWDGDTLFGGDGSAVRSIEVFVSVTTPEEHLKGFPQGSGLAAETRKMSRSFGNYTQIFKTPYSISNTLKSVELHGGPELARLRLRKAIQHKTELERAILFQGGGTEHVEWGYIPSTAENPLTRFKGMGVGATDPAKAGWIKTKNGEWDSRFQFAPSSATIADINALADGIFDDTVDSPASTKVVFASNKWLLALSNMATNGTNFMSFGSREQASNSLGITIKTLESPVGNLRFVPMPLFRGEYEDYALVVDMSNIEVRPLRGRDTTLLANVSTQEMDGQLDYYITETGFECRHESTHAILKLV
jgi:hypothetical protein